MPVSAYNFASLPDYMLPGTRCGISRTCPGTIAGRQAWAVRGTEITSDTSVRRHYWPRLREDRAPADQLLGAAANRGG